jgi:hypothetical protein
MLTFPYFSALLNAYNIATLNLCVQVTFCIEESNRNLLPICNSIGESSSRDANTPSASREIPRLSWNLDVSLPCSQEPAEALCNIS